MTEFAGILSQVGANCKTCRKPFIYVGDWPPESLYTPGPKPWCTCAQEDRIRPEVAESLERSLSDNAPFYRRMAQHTFGWQCPVCGHVSAPWVASCPRSPHAQTVTRSATDVVVKKDD